MLNDQIRVEFKRSFIAKNLIKWLCIIFLIPLISFLPIKSGYYYFHRVELFQGMVGLFVPLIFPVLVIFIYLPDFLQEQKNHFITYTRSRISLSHYILVKGLMNAFLTGFIVFAMLLFTYLFVIFIEPNILHMVSYSPPVQGNTENSITFSQFMNYGEWTYVLLYSLWVAFNACVYTTIAFLLVLIIRRPFVALSAPFLFYHIFNFVAGVFGVARFSPLSTVFPFNIQQQELWTVMVPMITLLLILSILYIIVIRNREDWMI